MARGWESKSVESQIESASERRAGTAETASSEEIERRTERDRLEHSRARVLHDLEVASNPRYREMLTASLKFLDDKLAQLRSPD
jgi:hypothetical protein